MAKPKKTRLITTLRDEGARAVISAIDGPMIAEDLWRSWRDAHKHVRNKWKNVFIGINFPSKRSVEMSLDENAEDHGVDEALSALRGALEGMMAHDGTVMVEVFQINPPAPSPKKRSAPAPTLVQDDDEQEAPSAVPDIVLVDTGQKLYEAKDEIQRLEQDVEHKRKEYEEAKAKLKLAARQQSQRADFLAVHNPDAADWHVEAGLEMA